MNSLKLLLSITPTFKYINIKGLVVRNEGKG